MGIASINPATGDTLAEFAPHDDAEIERRLGRADVAFRAWRERPVRERAEIVRRAADLLEQDIERLARVMTLEMGKTIASAREEVRKCAVGCRYYADHAEQFLADEPIGIDGERAFIAYQPLGVVLAVMPWNFPFWQVIRFAAPALCAGNVGLLKHASNVPQCALELEALFERAGAPDGAFQALLVGGDAVARIVADPRVAAATLTGSEGAGSSVAETAGRHIKKTVLELGGSDPFVVLPSADLERAAATAVRARAINNGQSCIAAKRFIAHESVYDRFVGQFVEGMAALRVGNPLADDVDIGPLATAQLREELHDQVRRSVAAGARVLLGGKPVDAPGAFYEPTVLVDIAPGSPAHDEELFGPVASVFRARDAQDALRIANDSRYGLGASVWTTDPAEAEYFARELACGSVFVNGQVVSDPRAPFGGIKMSGYGRELSAIGMREFTNIKTVRITGL